MPYFEHCNHRLFYREHSVGEPCMVFGVPWVEANGFREFVNCLIKLFRIETGLPALKG